MLIAEDDLPKYTIEYRGDEDGLFSFHFYLSQEDGGTLLFPHEVHMKWHRDPDARVPWGMLLESEKDATPASDP